MIRKATQIIVGVWELIVLACVPAWAPPLPQIPIPERVALAKYIFVGRQVGERFGAVVDKSFQDKPSLTEPYQVLFEVEIVEVLKPLD